MGYPKTASKCEEMAGELLGCFVAGTAVQMADGTTKPIEQLQPGDMVWSRDPSSGDTEPKRVVRTSVRHALSVLDLAFAVPATGATEHIVTTSEHPFYVADEGFVRAGSLGIGTQIVTRAGPSVSVTATETRNDRDGYTVYNLTVEGDHTYFMGTIAGGVWVHNALCEKFASFEQAMNSALKWLDERGFRAQRVNYSKPMAGRPGGVPNGMKTADGKVGFRVEWDPDTGAHINVFDHNVKRPEGGFPHFLFPGDEQLVAKICTRFVK